MSAIVLYDRLTEVSEELYLAIAYLPCLTEQERTSLEALWVRLDDLVGKIPEAAHKAHTAIGAEEDV